MRVPKIYLNFNILSLEGSQSLQLTLIRDQALLLDMWSPQNLRAYFIITTGHFLEKLVLFCEDFTKRFTQ